MPLNKYGLSPVNSRFPTLQKELDNNIVKKVYENQNGNCCQCKQAIYVIVKVMSAFTGEQGYIGLCESHSSHIGVGKEIVGIKASEM